MKVLLPLLFLLLLTTLSRGQSLTIETVTELEEALQESSGLLNLDGRIITHTDSEGDAHLYEVNPEAGEISRTVTISNAENHDWEDLAQDEQYLYIGDIGNNTGDRTNLRIYRIRKSTYLGSSNTVTAEVIEYKYPDQADFTPSSSSNFDAEALIAIEDSLYIFTKNWGNNKSTIYSLPKTPGTYVAKRIGELDTQGFITGATYNSTQNEIILIGYTPIQPFVFRISGFSGYSILAGNTHRLDLPIGLNIQIEGICQSNRNGYYIASEGTITSEPTLFHLSFGTTTSTLPVVSASAVRFFPNPAKEWLQVEHEKAVLTEIIDAAGRKVYSTSQTRINLTQLQPGIYLVHIRQENGILLKSGKLLIE